MENLERMHEKSNWSWHGLGVSFMLGAVLSGLPCSPVKYPEQSVLSYCCLFYKWRNQDLEIICEWYLYSQGQR